MIDTNIGGTDFSRLNLHSDFDDFDDFDVFDEFDEFDEFDDQSVVQLVQ